MLGDQSILLHELVHHAQCIYNASIRTSGLSCAREVEAFGLQAKFIRYVAEQRSSDSDNPRCRNRRNRGLTPISSQIPRRHE
jgi:hypothetical protein